MNMNVPAIRSNDEARALRVAAGYSQAQLAAALGVARETICRWETGTRPIPRTIRIAIAAVCQEKARLGSSEAG